ncbi:hypothetical protein QR680_002900 [Steinernema hermaphroditum]|uniref:Uncharacterized protein n=1 Tax=Steinernema hermaphroditum TaxID=289476 RepID=A0AA39H5G4_9BILA|nr:hypothetical protein QR680_002900 [Steinernema hermaphroditum]
MTVIRLPNGGYRIYAKGASEIVLSRCSYILGKDGELTPLGDGQKAEMTKTVIEPMASDGLRTIGLAYKDFVPENAARNEVLMTGDINWDDEETIRDAMVAIAVVGLQKERNNVRSFDQILNHDMVSGGYENAKEALKDLLSSRRAVSLRSRILLHLPPTKPVLKVSNWPCTELAGK